MEREMIEISDWQPCLKNGQPVLDGRIATFSAYIIPKHETWVRCGWFQKGNQNWVSLPSERWEKRTGEIVYTELIALETPDKTKRAKEEIKKAVRAFLEAKPKGEAESALGGSADADDLPF